MITITDHLGQHHMEERKEVPPLMYLTYLGTKANFTVQCLLTATVQSSLIQCLPSSLILVYPASQCSFLVGELSMKHSSHILTAVTMHALRNLRLHPPRPL